MFLTRSTRRLAVRIAAVLLLACQSAALAHACCDRAPNPEPAQEAPCHDGAVVAGANSVSGGERCQQASSPPAGFSIPEADELPQLAAAARDDRLSAAAPALTAGPPLPRVHSPPHAILHCCLRN